MLCSTGRGRRCDWFKNGALFHACLTCKKQNTIRSTYQYTTRTSLPQPRLAANKDETELNTSIYSGCMYIHYFLDMCALILHQPEPGQESSPRLGMEYVPLACVCVSSKHKSPCVDVGSRRESEVPSPFSSTWSWMCELRATLLGVTVREVRNPTFQCLTVQGYIPTWNLKKNHRSAVLFCLPAHCSPATYCCPVQTPMSLPMRQRDVQPP
jgi:hypothetical protein